MAVGLVYVVIGRVFSWPTEHVKEWRLAAWIVSLAVFSLHLTYERLRLQHSPLMTSLHAAFAVALGSIGIAVAGLLYTVSQGIPVGARWVIALVVFPLVTGVPAFIGAYVVTALLPRIRIRFPI